MVEQGRSLEMEMELPYLGMQTLQSHAGEAQCLLVLCLRKENDELKFNKSLNARQGHLKWELSPFD